MTHEEYAEMLRAALKACAAVCAGETMHKNGLVMALEKAQSALATPPPSNKLRPMKDAPRDGSRVLAYLPAGDAESIYFRNDKGWWESPDQIFSNQDLGVYIGWIPLPEASV